MEIVNDPMYDPVREALVDFPDDSFRTQRYTQASSVQNEEGHNESKLAATPKEQANPWSYAVEAVAKCMY